MPLAPLDESGVFLPGFGGLEGKSAVDQATTDWILDNLQEKGVLLAVEHYPHSYPHCWRCKTGAAVPAGGRVVHQHVVARRDHADLQRHPLDSRVSTAARAGLAQEHGRLDDLQEALLGPGAADLGL